VLADADNPFWHACVNDTDNCLPDPCDVNGTCQDELYSHICICDPGWEGDNCSQSKRLGGLKWIEIAATPYNTV
jgi:hypothetical protein